MPPRSLDESAQSGLKATSRKYKLHQSSRDKGQKRLEVRIGSPDKYHKGYVLKILAKSVLWLSSISRKKFYLNKLNHLRVFL